MMTNSKFNSKNVINEHLSEADLKTYFVGFDFGDYRYDHLVSLILDKIVEFSFGFHQGISPGNSDPAHNRRLLIEASKSIYKIFEDAKKKYVDEDSEYDDDIEDKYLKRGEFGEIILHLFLRDFIQTVPLISKIYFKDSDGMTVHGFDAVHIGKKVGSGNKTDRTLYLGESKLYKDGNKGVTALIKDIEDHFKQDFLKREFILIGKKANSFTGLDEYEDKNTEAEYKDFLKEKDHWFSELDKLQTGEGKLQDLFSSVTIPLLCTYTSKVFEDNTDEDTDKFKNEYENEIRLLKEVFDKKLESLKAKYKNSSEPISTDLNVVLMLFPVPSKKELVKRLHTQLHSQQNS